MVFDTRFLLAMVVTISFVGVLAALLLVPPQSTDEGIRNILNIMLGVLGAALGQVISYYFGSSSGSRAKDEALVAAATGFPPPKNGGVE